MKKVEIVAYRAYMERVADDIREVMEHYPLQEPEKVNSLLSLLVSYITTSARQHYIIGHLAAAESLHALEKDNPGFAKRAVENYRDFQAAFEELIGGSDRDGKHWALDRELLRSMVDGIVAFLSKEAQDGREETGGEKRR